MGALLFPMCSPKVLKATCKVLNVFPKMVPIAVLFSPIYIYRWAKAGGGTQYFNLERIKTFILESLHNFSIIFCGWANENGSFATKTKLLNLGTLNPKLLNSPFN